MNRSTTQRDETNSTVDAGIVKKPYSPPVIEQYGRISDITLTAPAKSDTEGLGGSQILKAF